MGRDQEIVTLRPGRARPQGHGTSDAAASRRMGPTTMSGASGAPRIISHDSRSAGSQLEKDAAGRDRWGRRMVHEPAERKIQSMYSRDIAAASGGLVGVKGSSRTTGKNIWREPEIVEAGERAW